MLRADTYYNSLTGETWLVNKDTGEVFKKRNSMNGLGFGPWGGSDQGGSTGSGGSGFSWDKVLNTVEDIFNNPAVQKLTENLVFEDGKFRWGSSSSGGGSVYTPNTDSNGNPVIVVPPAPTSQGIPDAVWYVGGGLLLVGLLIVASN